MHEVVFETLTDLQNATPTLEGEIAVVQGYTSAGDGGGGQFIYKTTGMGAWLIRNVTATSPIVITTTAAHNLVSGQTVMIAGVQGVSGANGSWTITVPTIGGTTFSLDGSSGSGSYTSSTGTLGDGGVLVPTAAATTNRGVWMRQYEGALNAKWWGAKGDGSGDDTVALQRALNYVSHSTTVGNTLFIPAGTYYVSQQTGTVAALNLGAASGVRIVGGSSSATKIQWYGASPSPSTQWDGTALLKVKWSGYCEVSGLRFDAAHPSIGGNSAGMCLYVTSDGNILSNITILTASNDNPIVVRTSSSHGLSTGQVVTIRGVQTNTAANGTWPVTVTSSTTFTIPVAGVASGTGGYVVGASGTVSTAYNLFRSNEFRNAKIACVSIGNTDDVTVDMNRVRDSFIDANGGSYGVRINGVSINQTEVSGCGIQNAAIAGVEIGTTRCPIFQNNIMSNNGTAHYLVRRGNSHTIRICNQVVELNSHPLLYTEETSGGNLNLAAIDIVDVSCTYNDNGTHPDIITYQGDGILSLRNFLAAGPSPSSGINAFIYVRPNQGTAVPGARMFVTENVLLYNGARFSVANDPALNNPIRWVDRGSTITTDLSSATDQTPPEMGLVGPGAGGFNCQVVRIPGQMSPITATGTTPPTLTVSGVPLGVYQLRVEITTGGSLGTALFRWSTDAGTTWQRTGLATAASVILPGTGLALAFASGTYATNNVYTARSAIASIKTGTIKRNTIKVTVDYSAYTANNTVQGVPVCTLPARTRIVAVVADTTQAYALSGASALSMKVDPTSGGGYFIASHDVKTAPVTKGLATADVAGGNLDSTNATQFGWMASGSWTSNAQITATLTATGANLGNDTVTSLTAGSTTLYITTETLD